MKLTRVQKLSFKKMRVRAEINQDLLLILICLEVLETTLLAIHLRWLLT